MHYIRPGKKLLLVWRLRTAAGAIVPAVLTSLFFTPLSVQWQIITAAWVLGFAFAISVYLPLRYLSTSYCVDDRTMEINRGVVRLTSKIVLLRNVEFITLESAPDERLFGLCSLSLFVVGGRVSLPGLSADDARLLSSLLPGGSRFESDMASQQHPDGPGEPFSPEDRA